jgi:hypothetical protein
LRAVLARISRTSRQLRFGFAASISATTPETIGVDAEVPVKSLRYAPRSVVVVTAELAPDDGAQTVRFAPGSP